ncbi:MAG: undecaprenyldiphospho-muramoylpentapeptide beta-N-acetylglucosaminyltransferase [Gammaproteobacteria bacterium]
MTHIVIVAGGTGGHLAPGIAVAEALQKLAARVSWLAASARDRDFVCAKMALPPEVVIVPYHAPRGVLGLLRLPFAVLRALGVLWKLRPRAVVGFGGFASVPGALAAKLLRLPLVIHEQNAVAGRANRLLSRYASRVLASYADAPPQSVHVGNPVGRVFAKTPPPQKRYAGRSGPLNILVLGGSQGAEALDRIVPLALARAHVEVRVLHQCAVGNKMRAEKNYLSCADARVRVVEFVDDVAAQMANADLLVCRAGASTLAEAAAVGVACFLIPYPHAADDHQVANAGFFAAAEAGVCSGQDIAESALAMFLQESARGRLLRMAMSARRLAKPNAAAEAAEVCMEVAGAL